MVSDDIDLALLLRQRPDRSHSKHQNDKKTSFDRKVKYCVQHSGASLFYLLAGYSRSIALSLSLSLFVYNMYIICTLYMYIYIIYMSGGQNYLLLAMDMAKVGGPLSVAKVCTSMLCVKIGYR